MISLIIPVYNAESTIKDCLESVLNQTFQSWEAILVDDGSKDMSSKICDEYASLDDRFHVIHVENSGVSNARNQGLLLARGLYIGFLDSDDKLENDFMQTMHLTITKENADLVVCGYKLIKSGRTIGERGISSIYNSQEQLMSDIEHWDSEDLMNPPWNKLYKRNLIDYKFNADYSLGEDSLFNFHYLQNNDCKKIVFIKDRLYRYSAISGGLTSKYKRNNIQCIVEKYDFIFNNKQLFENERAESYTKNRFAGEIHYYLRLLGIATLNAKVDFKREITYIRDVFKNSFDVLQNIQDKNLRFLMQHDSVIRWWSCVCFKALPYWILEKVRFGIKFRKG